MTDKIKWGVIGAAGIADRRTIPEGIVPAENAELALLMDANLEAKSSLEEKYKVPFVGTLEEALAAEIDAVYIATPTFLHEEQAVAAFKAGKHVLCEKPLALDAKAAGRMIEQAKESNKKLGTGYMMQFNAYHQRFKKMLSGNEFGTPVMGRAQLTCWFPPMDGNWRQIRAKGGGGALADMGTHCVDLLEMFFGKTKEVFAMTGTLVQKYEDPSVEDTAAMLLRFESGTMGFVDAHFNIPDESSEYVLELYGSKGCTKATFTVCQGSEGNVRACLLKDSKDYDAAQASTQAGYEALTIDSPANIYQSEIEAFSQAVLDDVEPPIPGQAGQWGLKVLEAAYESAKTGKAVGL